MIADTYLEGIYSEIYPDISRDADGIGVGVNASSMVVGCM
jgi:phosphoketolase